MFFFAAAMVVLWQWASLQPFSGRRGGVFGYEKVRVRAVAMVRAVGGHGRAILALVAVAGDGAGQKKQALPATAEWWQAGPWRIVRSAGLRLQVVVEAHGLNQV
ncbi:hypothetical protein GCM10011419_07640 [Vogesella fluminis]|uniref:Secreted protein n=1 Tax=Vogesella fluminis TaxID=1069161 RepID=A0ABQ3H8N6_9NEIS|nr:hypothetical protein GCM10011419_07640 [Vogesella fluminis]